MEIYVVVESWQYDDGDCGEQVNVYNSLEQARKHLDELVLETRITFQGRILDGSYTIEEDDMWFTCYETGEYCYNHYNATIYQRDVL